MLTSKQEKFAQNLFQGMTQRESWIQAGYSSNYDVKAIDINACAMAKTTKIKLRLAELNAPIVEKIQGSREKKLEILQTIYAHKPLPDTITPRDRVTAIAEHNKMTGAYEPVKIDITTGLEDLLSKLKGRQLDSSD